MGNTLLLSRSVVIPKMYEYLTYMTANFIHMRNVLDVYRNKDNSVVIFYRAKNGESCVMNIELKWKDIFGMERH